MTKSNLLRILLFGLIASSVGTALSLPPVGAHEGAGVLVVEVEEGNPDGSVRLVVRLTWRNDGHPALDATVTATAVDAGGRPTTPVSMTSSDRDGRYQATVVLPSPGVWLLRLTAVTPAATSELTRNITATTTLPAPTSSEQQRPTSTDLADDGATVGSEGTSSTPVGVAVIGAAVAGMVGVTIYVRRRHRPR
jgi:hypothetical protein